MNKFIKKHSLAIMIVMIAFLLLALVWGLYLIDKYLSDWLFIIAAVTISMLYGWLQAKIIDYYEKIEISKNREELLKGLKKENEESNHK